MAEIPVKPISELEVKSTVSENDKILILDSETDEARLAPKDEIKGDKGDTGETGPQGPQGIQGIQGEKGDKGDAFTYEDFTPEQLEGLRGPQGIQGPQGVKGDRGEKGEQGIQGVKGDTGASINSASFVGNDIQFGKDDGTNVTLSDAKTNLKGDRGEKGDAGAKGDTGPQGPQGEKGEKGDKGDTGASITGVSFVGDDMVFTKDDSTSVTLEDAKVDLKGEQGETGETGPKGDTGDEGNGIASITSNKVGKTTTVTITETKGTKTIFDIKDGLDGDGAGDVIGPDGANNGNVAVYDGNTGKLIKDGGRLNSIAFSGITSDMAGDNISITGGGSSGETSIKEGVDSINISNGVKDGLISFKTYGGTKQVIAGPEVIVEVPEGYTILEYLQASGTQYLDLEFPLIEDDEIELEAKVDTIGNTTLNIFGGRTQAMENNIEVILSQGRWMIDWNNSVNTTYRLTVDATTDKTRFVLNKNRRAIYTGDTLLGEQVLTCPDSITTMGAFLFFVKGGTLAATNKFVGKVYSLKIKDKINLIPVKNSSGVLGMYDTINKIFYTNKGTGSFTAGPSVYPSIENPVKILTNNGVLKLINTLPDGYSQLEYLESSGTQAINTGIYDVDRIETELKSKYNRQYTAMFASYTDENSLCTRMIWSNTSVSLYYINSVAKAGRGCNFSQNTWHKIKLYEEGSNEVIDIDGTITSTPKVSGNPNTANIHLFANKNGADGAPTAFKYFKAYKGGELIFDAVPVKRKTDNVLGMYDKVSGTFLTNVGTGAFTAGPEVEQEKKMVIDGLQEIITDEIGNNATAELLLRVGNYKDEQEILNGNVIRKIGIKVLDGSETWGVISNSRGYYTMIDDLKQIAYTEAQLICSHFSWYIWTDNTQSMPENSIGCNKNASTGITNGNITIRPNLTDYPDIASFKVFLKAQYDAGTPVIIIYPLNDDTTESVSGQTLSTVDGENTIRVSQSSMEGLELKMEYMLPGDSKINFVNNSGFITNTVENLVNYYKKSETYTQAEVDALIGGIVGVEFEVVQALPQEGENGVIYLVPNGGSAPNVYDEYIWLASQTRFEKIGTTEIDLSNYVTTQDLNTALANYVTSTAFTQALASKQDTISDLSTIRNNASAGKTAKDTIDTYGDIVTHDASEFATASQGGKADTAVQPGDLGTASALDTGTTSGTIPVLDTNGHLPTSTIPGVALTDTFTVATKSDLITLTTADQGDIGIVTGENKTYVLSEAPYSTLANWKELLTPTDSVTSVNGKTGVVALDADDIDDTNTTKKFVTQTDKDTWDGKQDELESGVNIRTINGTSILGSGNIDTPTGIPSQTGEAGKFLTTDGSSVSWATIPGGLQVAPNSPITGIKYIWYGTEAQYAALTQYYTEVEGDTEFHTF